MAFAAREPVLTSADPFGEPFDRIFLRLEGVVLFDALREGTISNPADGGFFCDIDLRILPICPAFGYFNGAVDDGKETVNLLGSHVPFASQSAFNVKALTTSHIPDAA